MSVERYYECEYGPRYPFAGCLLAGFIPTVLAGAVTNAKGLMAIRFFVFISAMFSSGTLLIVGRGTRPCMVIVDDAEATGRDCRGNADRF